MTNLKCPNCTSVLVKSNKGEYIYHCPYCEADVDIRNHSNITISEDFKDRYCKAAYTHICNGGFLDLNKARKLLDRLELEYPDDNEVQKLSKMYYLAKSEHDRQERKERMFESISSWEKKEDFWKHENGYINMQELKYAFPYLDYAEEYQIDCPIFQLNMWRLFNDVLYGRVKLTSWNNSELESEHRFYKMFLMGEQIHNKEIQIEQTKMMLEEQHSTWNKTAIKSLNQCLVGGIVVLICSIFIFFYNIKSRGFRNLSIILMLISVIMILSVVWYCFVANSKNSFFKKLLVKTIQHEKRINEIQNSINELEKEKVKKEEMNADLQSEYTELTWHKTIEWSKEHKELFQKKE